MRFLDLYKGVAVLIIQGHRKDHRYHPGAEHLALGACLIKAGPLYTVLSSCHIQGSAMRVRSTGPHATATVEVLAGCGTLSITGTRPERRIMMLSLIRQLKQTRIKAQMNSALKWDTFGDLQVKCNFRPHPCFSLKVTPSRG